MVYYKYLNCNCCGYFCVIKRFFDLERSIFRVSLGLYIDLWNIIFIYNFSFCLMFLIGGDYDCDSFL